MKKRGLSMKWKEIVKKFKDEWVLIEVKEVDEDYHLKEGIVIAHSRDKSDIYEQLLKLKDKNLYIEYTGKIPEDLAVVLSTASKRQRIITGSGYEVVPVISVET